MRKKQKMVAIILTVLICLTSILNSEIVTEAEETSENIDFSYLMTDKALVGYSESVTKGVYYSDGYSIINKISTTKIGAGGVTNAVVKCKVSITSIVERKTSSGWSFVTSWTQTNENAYSAMISKSLTVATGYYYRVRSSHYASTDTSSSWTDALKM